MADSKISDLAAVTSLIATDEFVLASSGSTKKIAASDLAASLSSDAGLLAVQAYAPTTQTVYSTTSATMADVDATNAAVTFTAPASGNVLVRASCWLDLDNTGEGYIGLRESTTDLPVITRVARGPTHQQYASVPFYVSGISAGSHTYKLSFGRQTAGTFRLIIQDGSAIGEWGNLIIEVWSAP